MEIYGIRETTAGSVILWLGTERHHHHFHDRIASNAIDAIDQEHQRRISARDAPFLVQNPDYRVAIVVMESGGPQ